jgi:hypothetical protein
MQAPVGRPNGGAIAMSDPQACLSVASQTRQIAERIRQIPHEVLASFQTSYASLRVPRLQRVESEILFGMLPFINWLERSRPPDKAELVKRQLDHVLREAVQCAGTQIPEYEGGTVKPVEGEPPSAGAIRTATLFVYATALADSLLPWADEIESEDKPSQSVEATEDPGLEQFKLRNNGGSWEIRFAAESGNYPVTGNKGLKHLAELLSRPYRALAGLELQGLSDGNPQPEHSFQEVADDQALTEMEEEAKGLAGRIETARRNNALGEVERLLAELETLTNQINQSKGLVRRKRRLGRAKPEEKAFDSVRRNINRCYERMRDAMPNLVSHLEKTIKPSSSSFMYIPSYDPLCPNPDWKS